MSGPTRAVLAAVAVAAAVSLAASLGACRGSDGPEPGAAPPASSGPSPIDAAAPPRPDGRHVFTFDGDPTGRAPLGFTLGRTGHGVPGRWEVAADPDAAQSRYLAQLDPDTTEDRFLLALADLPHPRDLRLSARVRMVTGSVDQAAGLVWRCRDERNYYLTRANSLEGNVRLYFVRDGLRRQLADWRGEIPAGVWHDYRVEMRGDHIRVWWDGRMVIEHRDATFPDAGRVGVWTKADSVSWFDDVTVEGL